MPDRRFTLKNALNLELKEALLLYALRDWGPMGRGTLEMVLGLPEGIVRGLLKRAQIKGWIKAERTGCSITEEGKDALYKKMERMGISSGARIPGECLGIGPSCHGVLIRGAANRIHLGIEQRDAAVRVGAKGAVSLVYLKGRLIMPGICENVDLTMPEVSRAISAFQLQDGDLVVIAFADNIWRAVEGAFSAAQSTKFSSSID